MEFWLGIIGILISSLISVIFSEEIINAIGIFLSKYDLKKKCEIEGDWLAEFTLIENNNISHFKETIRLVKRLGIYYGYNVPNPNNHDELKKVEQNQPLRIKASLSENKFLTGNWYHPNRQSRFHGSFQMLIVMNTDKMYGIWTGYSESKNEIDSGKWNWKKLN